MEGGPVMKSKMIIIPVLALIFGACTTGSQLTTSWVDDIYFSPGDVPPPVVTANQDDSGNKVQKESDERIIISEIKGNQEGSKTMNNYIFDGQDAGEYADAQLYNMEQMELVGSDTTVYYDENEVKYVINNYFEGDEMDFSYRIHRFHRPYFYDPYYFDYYAWDPYYDPYWGSSWSFGWGGSWGWPYYSWGYPYSSWYSPFYSSWYAPYSYYGWGGYPYYSWHSPYWGGYYGNVYYIDRDDYRYGQRRDYNTSALYGSGSAGRSGGTSAALRNQDPLKSAQPGRAGVDNSGRRGSSISGVDNGGRTSRNVSGAALNSRTHTELRRGTDVYNTERGTYGSTNAVRNTRSTQVDPEIRTAGQSATTQDNARRATNYTRPATTTTGNAQDRYTPSYNQARPVTRQTYNVQGTSRPSTNPQRSGTVSGTTYSRPTSTSNTYRSTSTYNRSSGNSSYTPASRPSSSSSSGSRSTYSAPSSSPSRSSSPSYTPSRSSAPSGGSISTGGSSSGGSSRSSSSSSGRR